MTDGPFRNLRLSSRWKMFGEQLVSDAASPAERVNQACHSMMTDAGVAEFTSLVRDLDVCAAQPQMTLDPIGDIETIIEGHPMSPLSDILRRTLLAKMRDGLSLPTALQPAMNETIREWVGIVRNRLDEHCIQARDNGDMSRVEYQIGLSRNAEAFSAIDVEKLSQAIKEGNRTVFRTLKQLGVDEGPEQ